MSRDTLSFLAMGLCCLGFLALVVITYVSTFKRFRKFSAAVGTKLSGWDEFASRTGLQWESKTPTYNPVADKLFGSDTADKTGRVIGTYRGYPVVLCNQTRNRVSHTSFMVAGQNYYTEFHLTIQNPAEIHLTIRKKDNRLAFEPQDIGEQLLGTSNSFERLVQIPASFGIAIQSQELYYIQAGIEQDANRLYDTLETLCDLADAVGSRSPQ
jgi:hypothetical protein